MENNFKIECFKEFYVEDVLANVILKYLKTMQEIFFITLTLQINCRKQ